MSELRTQVRLEDQQETQQMVSSEQSGISAKQQREHYNERLEDRVRAVQIEVESKTREVMKAKFEKRELEQQQKYQEMTTAMQKQCVRLALRKKIKP